MAQNPDEWLRQADYDIDNAEFMFKNGRYIYTIFMCHLSIEKALKGLYIQKTGKLPPKTHNLLYLAERINIQLPDNLYDSIFTLNKLSVPTRYPDDLQRMLKDYNEERTRDIIERGKEVLQWVKTEFMKR